MVRNRIAAMVIFSGLIFSVGCSAGVGKGGACDGVCAGTTETRSSSAPSKSGERTTQFGYRDDAAHGEGIFFPTMPPQAAVPDALTRGVLALSEKGCLLIEPLPKFEKKSPRALAHYPGTVPIWPSNFEPDASGDKVRVLDERGRVVAQVDERVWMGGGEISAKTLRGNDLMDERELGALSRRCPNDYWMVGEDPHIPGRRN